MGQKLSAWQKGWLEKTEEGSYAVEAAFVVPIVAGIAFLILYTLFLQHDRVILQANLDNVIFLAAEGDSDCGREVESNLQEFLWCMEVREAELSEGMVWVCGSVTAEASWNIPVVSFFVDGMQKISLSERYSRIQPEEIIRYGTGLEPERNNMID